MVSPTPTPTASGPGRFETAPPLPEPRQPDPQGTPVPVPEDRLAAIRADLADRGVAGDDLVVISSRSVTWNDGSLGCPEPGMAYTQALVPGMHVVVAVGETQYDYRFGAGTVPRLCVPLPLR